MTSSHNEQRTPKESLRTSDTESCAPSSEDENENAQLIKAAPCSVSLNKLLRQQHCKFKGKTQRKLRRVASRGMRRVTRVILCAILTPMFLCLLFYLPIYTSVPDRHTPLTDWTFNTSLNIADYVLPMEKTTLISPRNMCQNKTFLIILVTSSINNFVQRQNIRESWGNLTDFNYAAFSKLHAHLKGHYLNPTQERLHFYSSYMSGVALNATTASDALVVSPLVRIVFLLGRSKFESLMGNETLSRLHNEAQQYNDIIQENFIDTYNNLTIKSVLALKYISKQCTPSSVAFFMKCDDDTFVNIPNLLHFLLGGTIPLYNDTITYYDQLTYQVMSSRNRLTATSELLLGHLFCSAVPHNKIGSKWYMPYYMYPDNLYPNYLSGSGYLMSMDVASRLYKAALNTSLIHLEDVYLTGICGEVAHIKRRHQPLFSFTHSSHWCTFKGTITQHEIKGNMQEAWQFVSNYSKKCPPPAPYFQQMRLRKHNNNCK